MPYAYGTAEQRSERAKCNQAFSPLILNSNNDTSMAGGSLFDILDFVADQNYIIVKATLSFGIIAPFGTENLAIIGWTLDPNALDWTLQAQNLNNGNVIAALVATFFGGGAGTGQGGPGQNAQTWDFADYPIYLTKGQTVSLCASSIASTDIVYSATLYLLPTFA